MMTIREAIKKYTERKANSLNKDYLDVVKNTSLCIIIPMNNGVEIFIDTHPEAEYLKEKFPLEMPNKNGIFKRISFEILDNGIMPTISSLKNHISKSSANDILYYADTVKERIINEFIIDNGGIDEDKFMNNIKLLWNY